MYGCLRVCFPHFFQLFMQLTYILYGLSADINTGGLTFLSRETFLKKNYLSHTVDNERHILSKVLSENILLNLRTYDDNSLLLYANDHLNNFIQLHIQDGKYIVLLFNSDNKILNITVEYTGKHHMIRGMFFLGSVTQQFQWLTFSRIFQYQTQPLKVPWTNHIYFSGVRLWTGIGIFTFRYGFSPSYCPVWWVCRAIYMVMW